MTAKQRSLFDDDAGPWEVDDQPEQLVATVLFTEGPRREFDYSVPAALHSQIEPGRRVLAPFGKGDRPLIGYCIATAVRVVSDRALKSVREVIDARTLLSPAMMRLTRWIADHYLCDWVQVLEAVVPAGVRGNAGTRPVVLFTLAENAKAKAAETKLTAKHARILNLLADSPQGLTAGQIQRMAGCTVGPLQWVRRHGLVISRKERVSSESTAAAPASRQAALELNPSQRDALGAIHNALRAAEHRTILIHGVTGSGKTEVYIQAIEAVVRSNRQAIVLVPEISLTPQTVERFRSRFEHVAVLHSHLSDAERHWQWQHIANGRIQVVVGARSAVFAPTPRLGLIVLDEEHESSFKQDSVPRYHARDVAMFRAREESVPLVLGSATPSLDSWQRAQRGEFQLVDMPRRVLDRPLPEVGTIDLRVESFSKQFRGALARPLVQAINTALSDDGQVILLLNRRGYSTHIQCPACGLVMLCPDCDIALTHHRTRHVALCHYCDYEIAAPADCPQCRFDGIRYSGQGTQRLEAEVQARFPHVPCLRMDTDSMLGRGAHEKALSAFRAGKYRILLGTQMIAKGLDFPNVTLVGVVNADTALHLPDFRAAERTFHLVTQVAGRTGRGEKGGRVLVQTFNPDHPAIRAAANHDYAAFAQQEIPIRQMFGYPPFGSMVRLVIRGPVENNVQRFAAELVDRLKNAAGENARVLGPAPAPFARLRGKFRYQIQLQSSDGDLLRAAVRAATANLTPPDEVQWIADVDPLDML